MPFKGTGKFFHYYFYDDYYGWVDGVFADGEWKAGMGEGTLTYLDGS